MYLTYNQINKKDGINLETIQTKNMADKLFVALENYDYDYLRELERKHNTFTLCLEFINIKCYSQFREYQLLGVYL